MKVNRIVANMATPEVGKARAFYEGVLGLKLAMDMGWIATYVSDTSASPQVSFMEGGGSGTPVPDLSIEVDDLDEAERRMKAAGIPIEYGPVVEPWGVRRFFVRDPYGRLVNILVHAPQEPDRGPDTGN